MSEDATYRAFRIAYDGRTYHGFQRQPDQRTVSGEIREALRALGAPIDAEPGYAAAGRTDRGVSAVAQTIAVRCPRWLDAHALNGRLPDPIVAWAEADVPDAFHPRHDAVSREYVYHLDAPNADIDRILHAATQLTGVHDFRHFTADSDRSAGRVDAIDVQRSDPFVQLTVRAPGFLRQQVRRIATVLREYGAREREADELEAMLHGESLSGGSGVQPADPEPLVLTDVVYENVEFEALSQASDLAHRRFRGLARRERSRAATMRTIADLIC